MADFVQYVKQVGSVEQQCCRWSMNVIRNLVTQEEIAVIVATKTSFPALAGECLAVADTTDLRKWTRDSLEDACLMLLVHVCKTDDGLESLKQRTINQVTQGLREVGGVRSRDS